MGAGYLLAGTWPKPFLRSGSSYGTDTSQSGNTGESVHYQNEGGAVAGDTDPDSGAEQFQLIGRIIREYPGLLGQLPDLSWKRLGLLIGTAEDEPEPMSQHTSLFHSIWSKRGYSKACVDRMYELHTQGVPDREMLAQVKQEGLL